MLFIIYQFPPLTSQYIVPCSKKKNIHSLRCSYFWPYILETQINKKNHNLICMQYCKIKKKTNKEKYYLNKSPCLLSSKPTKLKGCIFKYAYWNLTAQKNRSFSIWINKRVTVPLCLSLGCKFKIRLRQVVRPLSTPYPGTLTLNS